MIEKIEWLWKEADKVCHVLCHVTITTAFLFCFSLYYALCGRGLISLLQVAISWFASIAWGVGYELYDHAREEGFDWNDITANFVGMFYGTILWLIVLSVLQLITLLVKYLEGG